MTKKLEGDYIELKSPPATPPNKIPTRQECEGYDYMFMTQLCNIAEFKFNIGRSKACNAFGGDKGKHKVISVRKARIYDGRKYVLVSAVIDYFAELGLDWSS